jgi:AraC-like DNA-binding protein
VAGGHRLSPVIPLIRAAPVRAFVNRLGEWGVPVGRLLDRARLSQRVLVEGDTEALVPLVSVGRFLEDTARSQGVEDLGFRLGTSIEVRNLGLFGRMLEAGPSLGDALARACRHWSAFDSGERCWITRCGDRVEVHHQYLHEEAITWEQGKGVALALYLKYIAAAAGPGWYPTRIGLPLRALPGAHAHPLLAKARLELGRPWMTIAVPASVLDRPLSRLRGPEPPRQSRSWDENLPAGDVGGALQQVVTAFLADGYPDIQLVADAVGLSTRTLQRRLHEDGRTYAGVVAQARFAEARRLLRDPARQVSDVALDLGYSDPAHFTRAFERWAGIPPREFRRLAFDRAH